jgi:Concanavalin A-like lectin/glucanases superfamily
MFDGVNDYVTTSNVIGGFTDYSAEFWFKLTTNTAGTEKWLGNQYPGGATGRVIFNIHTDNKLRNFISGTSINGNTTILTNTWYHAVFTRNSAGSATIYLNGSLDSSGTVATVTVVNTAFQIGGSTILTARWVNGTIATVKLYSRALSAAEVQQNFNALRGRFGI